MIVTLALSIAIVAAPIDVGGRKQLFVDKRFIAESDRIELRAIPPQKLGLVRDETGKPVEGHVSRVLDIDGKARLYLGHENVEVLESGDGLEFRRTGVRISQGLFPTIFLDPHERDPARKYKLFHLEFSEPFDPAKHGVFASHSADGVKFTKVGRVFPFFTDNPTIVHWDDDARRYVIYTRAFDYTSENQRRIGRIETDDPLKPWPYTPTKKDRLFPSIDNIRVVYSADRDDDPHSDVYYNAVTRFEDVYLMFPAHFRHFSPRRNPFIRPRKKGEWEDYGMLETQLAVSRDGINWSRPSRGEAYIPNGTADEWDRWYTIAGPGVVRRGNFVYQYYTSTGRLHDSVILRPEYDASAKRMGGVGVVRQRVDGFVSADADFRGGWLKTPLLTFRGNTLRLNIDTGAAGTAFVELLDASDRPIPGFTIVDCEEIGGNFLDQAVNWNGKTDLSALSGKPIRIQIRMKRAKLYAFQFTNSK